MCCNVRTYVCMYVMYVMSIMRARMYVCALRQVGNVYVMYVVCVMYVRTVCYVNM